jgi:hypothetical protein
VQRAGEDERNILAEIRFTPPRRARRRIAGLVIPWMLSRRIFRWRLAPPFPRPLPPLPPVREKYQFGISKEWFWKKQRLLLGRHNGKAEAGGVVVMIELQGRKHLRPVMLIDGREEVVG